jgi:aspartyl protease family protein
MLGFWSFGRKRVKFGQLAKAALTWLVIILVIVAAYGMWDESRGGSLRSQRMQINDQQITINKSADGHFHLILDIDGTDVQFLVDTGATHIVLSRKDAERLGIDANQLAYTSTARTANGEVRTSFVRLGQVSLGPVTDSNLPAWVNQGDMNRSLLGMSYLERWSKMELTRTTLTLTR